MSLSKLILEGGSLALIKDLLADGVSPDQLSEDGVPALALAATLKANDVVSLLIDAGANLNAKDLDGETALHAAAAVGNIDAIELLSSRGAQVDVKNAEGKTALMVAAIMGGLDACSLLVQKGSSSEVLDVQGRGLVHWAALRNDDFELIDFLIGVGANPHARDVAGMTPESLARLVSHGNALRAIEGRPDRSL